MPFPRTTTRQISLPKVRAGTSRTWDKIQTDTELIAANDVEQLLNIVGTGGITVSGTTGTPSTITIDGSGTTGGGGGTVWKSDEFDTTLNQISFSLSTGPTDPNSVFFIVNGIIYDDVLDFTVSGSTITWTNHSFNFEVGDKVIIKYV
jgi:hypothetical protein